MTKKIPERYWKELKEDRHTVPRYVDTREVISFRVGKEYDIIYIEKGEKIRARCTQDCPYHLKAVD